MCRHTALATSRTQRVTSSGLGVAPHVRSAINTLPCGVAYGGLKSYVEPWYLRYSSRPLYGMRSRTSVASTMIG